MQLLHCFVCKVVFPVLSCLLPIISSRAIGRRQCVLLFKHTVLLLSAFRGNVQSTLCVFRISILFSFLGAPISRSIRGVIMPEFLIHQFTTLCCVLVFTIDGKLLQIVLHLRFVRVDCIIHISSFQLFSTLPNISIHEKGFQ